MQSFNREIWRHKANPFCPLSLKSTPFLKCPLQLGILLSELYSLVIIQENCEVSIISLTLQIRHWNSEWSADFSRITHSYKGR